MADLTIYTFDRYKEEYCKIFAGVYNDFKMRAANDYNFELAPLEYEDFLKSVNDGLIKCIILFEQDIPTGFLSYTTLINEAVELNIIHVIQGENTSKKRFALLCKFMEEIKEIKGSRIISYPLLGVQEELIPFLDELNFKTVNQSVMVFDFYNIDTINSLCREPLRPIKHGYKTENWKDDYLYDTVKIVNDAFKDMSDAKFDSRFLTEQGTQDIILKITQEFYGKFLPEITKVLIYHEKVIGICFVNLTNSHIANIPLVAVNKNYRGKSFGKLLLKEAVTDLSRLVITGKMTLSEINASCDSDNKPAYNMYLGTGFKESYSYKHAFTD